MRTLRLLACVTLCLAASGCGGSDDESDPSSGPHAIPGGGVSGSPLAGRANVFVHDGEGAPLSGVVIWIGEGADATNAGSTDSSGHVVVTNAALVSGAVITAIASEQVGVSYAGVTGDVVSFVLASKPASADVTISGTITGWDALPDPATGRYRVARVVASRALDLALLDGIQPTPGENACFRVSGQPAECGFTLQAPATSELLLAVIAEGDDSGTPADFTDDALEATGLALGATSGGALGILSESDIARASVTLGNASGLVQVIGVPGVSAKGQVVLFPTFDTELASYPVPRAVGELAESKLWAVGAGAGAGDASHSLVVTRGISAPSGTEPVSFPVADFLAPPSVTQNAEAFEITRASGGFHALSFRGTNSLDVWILDERTSVTPPSGIELGGLGVEVSASEIPGDFHPGTLADDLSRRARQRL